MILAAGTSSRMGRQKLLAPFRGKRMIDYVIDAARRWQPVIVASAPVAQLLDTVEDLPTIVNGDPDRGMAHSLALADAAVPAGIPIIVLLADKPLITDALIARVSELAKDVDVAHPVHETSGEPGHPVVFSARARAKIHSLPDGDTLKDLRDDPGLTRRILPTADPGAFFDVDTPEQLER